MGKIAQHIQKFCRLSTLRLSALKITLGCSVILVSCAAGGSTEREARLASDVKNPPKVSKLKSNTFSTSGKPTKLYNTPNGPVRVYDISQDAEVIQAIEDVYEKGDLTFGDVSFKAYNVDYDTFFSPDIEVTTAAVLLTKARQISYYDLYRSSCKIVERAPCGNGDSGFNPRYFSECPTCNLGKPPDHNVERIAFNYNRTVEKFLTPDEIKRGRYPTFSSEIPTTAYLDECRDFSEEPLLKYYYIGHKSGYSLEETTKLLLHHNCSEWEQK